MNQQKYRAGILGAGYISSYHADAIARRSDAQLVAICDMNEQAANRLAGQVSGTKVYTDFSAMLAQENLNVIHVLTQPDSHLALTKMALEAGCDVIVEKPVTASAAEAIELSEIAKSSNRTVAVNHNFVFSGPFNRLVEAIESGLLGPLKSVRVVWKKPLPQLSSGPWNLWMLRDPRNILFETGSHSLSELLAIVKGELEIINVTPRLPKVLPSGSVFYRRWNISAQSGPVMVNIETAFDLGYQQHFVEVEGLFGVARADIEEDVFTVQLPTGRTDDSERLHSNFNSGVSRIVQACRSYGNYAASKMSKRALGNPYETSMHRGIANCYAEIEQSAKRRESSIAYAVSVAVTADAIAEKVPQSDPAVVDDRPAVPVPVDAPSADAKVLIVGATGFIGRNLLLEMQSRNIGVRAIVRNVSNLVGVELNENSEVMVGDYRNAKFMDAALKGVETVFHLAVAHGRSLDEYLQNDTQPTIEFAKQCQRKDIKRFVYTGTIDSLDLAHEHRLNEIDGVDDHLSRRNNYAHSKALAEKQLLELHHSEGFPVVIVRPAIVLGAGGPVTHLGVANWFGPGRCDYWGSGKNLIPAVLVDDVVQALIKIESTQGIDGRTYNLSAEPCISARDYVAEIEGALNCSVATKTSNAYFHFAGDFYKWMIKTLVRHPDRVRVPSIHDWRCREQHASFDTTAAQRDLDWHPTNDRQTIIEKGIREPAREYLAI